MNNYLLSFGLPLENIKIITSNKDISFDDDISYFNVADRHYTKKQTLNEIKFMNFLLPDKAKFVPYE